MKIGSLSNHGDSLIGITAEKGSRHHTQVELYEPEPEVRPWVFSSENYDSYDNRQRLVLPSLEKRL